MAKIYYDNDADLSLLKDKTIAILGYGSQGHAQAQNLRDSGCKVIVGQRPGSANYDLAVSHGFKPMSVEEATKQGDLVNILLPDEVQGDIYRNRIKPHLKPGNMLMCSHGFNVHFGQVEPPEGVDIAAGRPQGPGPSGAQRIRKGGGVPCLIALSDRRQRKTRASSAWPMPRASAARAAGVIETTFAEETETDLFGEQVVLCGGVSALVKAGFETLVEAGYQPEMAYFECMHELKLIVDLFYQGGLNYMRYSVSNTAEYGDYTRGPRIVTDETKAEMKKILEEIQIGPVRPRVDSGKQGQRAGVQSHPSPRAQPSDRRSRPQVAPPDALDQRQGSMRLAVLGQGDPCRCRLEDRCRVNCSPSLKAGRPDRSGARGKVGFRRPGPRQTVGTVVRTERRRHGLHFRRNTDDKVFSDMIMLKRDDGEQTTVTIDEFTELRLDFRRSRALRIRRAYNRSWERGHEHQQRIRTIAARSITSDRFATNRFVYPVLSRRSRRNFDRA